MYKQEYHDPEWLKDIVKKYLKSKSLNLCCGKSQFGDIRVDSDPSVNPDVVCDMWNLPFKRAEFNSIYCDPVWEKIPRKQSFQFMYMLKGLLKANGYLIWNSTWAFLGQNELGNNGICNKTHSRSRIKGLKTIAALYWHSRFGGIIVTIVYQKINTQLEEFQT